MRMLVHVSIPNDSFNAAVKEGTAGDTIKKILDETRPEAVYFTELDGDRGLVMVVDLADPSRVPSIAEPWFLRFDAQVHFSVCMTPEDLGRAGLESLGKAWG